MRRCLFQAHPTTAALFRVSISLASMYQLLQEWDDNCIFFNSGELFTFVPQQFFEPTSGGLYEITETCREVTLVKSLQLCCTLSLLLGFCSRSSALLCYFFQLSDHRRRVGSTGGDLLLTIYLLWASLVPIGHRWSLDALLSFPPAVDLADRIAVTGMQLQITLFYLQSVALKLTTATLLRDWNPWLTAGTAVEEVLTCCEFSSFSGQWMLRNLSPIVLALLTWSTLIIESVPSAILLCAPSNFRWARIASIASLVAFHLGADLGMTLLHFSYVCVAALFICLPPPLPTPAATTSSRSSTTSSRSSTTSTTCMVRGFAASVLICVTLAIQFDGFFVAYSRLDSSSRMFHDGSRFSHAVQVYIGIPALANMFSVPSPVCGWWVLPSLLQNGSVVETHSAYHTHARGNHPYGLGNTEMLRKPPLVSKHHNSDHWARFYDVLSSSSSWPESGSKIERAPNDEEKFALESLARFHCRQNLDIRKFWIVFMTEVYTPKQRPLFATNGGVPTVAVEEKMHVLWEKECGDGMGHRPVGGDSQMSWWLPLLSAEEKGNSGQDRVLDNKVLEHRLMFEGSISSQTWRTMPLILTNTSLRTESGEVVMGSDESKYMQMLVDAASVNGGRVLEIGFGMGITAMQFVESGNIVEHIVCEPNEGIYVAALGHGKRVTTNITFIPLLGMWEEITPKLRDGSFDAILYDAFPEAAGPAFMQEARRLLRPGGVLTFYWSTCGASGKKEDGSDAPVQECMPFSHAVDIAAEGGWKETELQQEAARNPPLIELMIEPTCYGGTEHGSCGDATPMWFNVPRFIKEISSDSDIDNVPTLSRKNHPGATTDSVITINGLDCVMEETPNTEEGNHGIMFESCQNWRKISGLLNF